MSKCRFFLGRSVLKKNFSGRSLKFSDNDVDWGVSTTAADSSSVDSTSSIGRAENLLLWASRRERLTSAARRQNPSSWTAYYVTFRIAHPLSSPSVVPPP